MEEFSLTEKQETRDFPQRPRYFAATVAVHCGEVGWQAEGGRKLVEPKASSDTTANEPFSVK